MNENDRLPKMGIVMDTSALMEHPEDVARLNAHIFVPLVVIKQLDGLKNNDDLEKNRKARQASSIIEEGIKLKKVTVLTQYDKIDGLASESDNKIVGAAVSLKKMNPDGDIMMLTTDRNMKIAASAYGIGVPNIEESLKRKIPWYLNGRLIAFLFILGAAMVILSFQIEASENTRGNILVCGMCIAFAGVYLGAYRLSVNRRRKGLCGPYAFSVDDGGAEGPVAKNLAIGITDPEDWVLY